MAGSSSRPTITVENRHARNITVDKLMDDLKHRCLHLRCLEIFIGPKIKNSQGLPEQLRLLDVDGNKFENTVLRHDADDHGTFGLIVDINEGNTT